jgi:hypothetical protein
MPTHQWIRNVVFSKCLGKVAASSRMPALVLLRTEESSTRMYHTADAYGTADATCIEVGIIPSGEGFTDMHQSAESKMRKEYVT